MYLWILVIALVVGCLLLTGYSAPHLAELFGPKGEMTTGIFSGIILLVLQILALMIAINFLDYRRREPARRSAVEALQNDIKVAFGFFKDMNDEYTGNKHTAGIIDRFRNRPVHWFGVAPDTANYFRNFLNLRTASVQINLLSAYLSPETIKEFAEYLSRREAMAHHFSEAIKENPEHVMKLLFSTNPTELITEEEFPAAVLVGWFLEASLELLQTAEQLGLDTGHGHALREQIFLAYDRITKALEPGDQVEAAA